MMILVMTSDVSAWQPALPIAIAIVLVVCSVFLGSYFFRKKIVTGNGDLASRAAVDNSQHQAKAGNDPTAELGLTEGNDRTNGKDQKTGNDQTDPDIGHEYEVFLSFRGSDIRKSFTDHLYHSLIDKGVWAFRDNEELRVGEEIGPKLMKSIKQSKIGIPIFTRDYASSKWCLKEVTEMVKCMKDDKRLIMPIFLDVTPDEVQHQTGSYFKPFSAHEIKQGKEIVQEWRDALKEVVKLKGLELDKVANGHEGEFIKLVVTTVLAQLKKAYLEMSNILVGIDERVQDVLKLLKIGLDDVRVVGIYGMGGVGKTTLAKSIFNQVVENFEQSSFLNDIRETSRTPRGLQYLQSKLVSDILRRDREDYPNVEAGISVLKNRLRSRRALILLDDVDHVDQLKALAADVHWFGKGSRIIITTRKKEILDQFQVRDTYEATLLTKDQAFELFCKHAFRDDTRKAEVFVKQSWEIVNITGQLPLALEVIGSFLSFYSGREEIWDSTVELLKSKPTMDVQDKLKISYDSLDHEQQEMFLDVACFFIGLDIRLVIPMWDECKFFPKVGIEILLLKSLIKIRDDNTIQMHDQLRDLGRRIVDEENYREPGYRSRLWRSEEAMDILTERQGTSKVEAISLEGYHFTEELEECLMDEMFTNLPRLRILELGSAKLDSNFRRHFRQLRWLSWHGQNSSFPASLYLRKLVLLDLSHSLIDENWTGWSSIKIGPKLRVLNLTDCPINRTIDFSPYPILERLILESCKNLVSIDPSIGNLGSLISLNLRKCSRLGEFPEQVNCLAELTELLIDETCIEELPISRGMKKLEIISANGCKSLSRIPKDVEYLLKLKRLSLEYCDSLTELPESIGHLTSLVELILSHSGVTSLPGLVGHLYNLEVLKIDNTGITRLPDDVGALERLEVLDASWCPLEEGIPAEIGRLSNLKVLRLDGLKSLPAGMASLSRLQSLRLGECKHLPAIPKLPASLVSLTVESTSMGSSPDFSDLVNLKQLNLSGDFELKQEDLKRLRNLEKLHLKSVKFHTLPEEIAAFFRLKEIYISDCSELESLPPLPASLLFLTINNCRSLQRLPNISNLTKLSQLHVLSCSLLTEIDGLGDLKSLRILSTSGSPLTSLNGLERLESLIDLSIASCVVERLPDLSKLQNLRQLNASACRKLVEVQGLGSLHELEVVNFSLCTSLELLPELPNSVQYLDLRNCERLQKLNGLEELMSLFDLDLIGCRALQKLPDLSKLKKLEYLRLEGCENIMEIPGIEEFTHLKNLRLYIRGTG